MINKVYCTQEIHLVGSGSGLHIFQRGPICEYLRSVGETSVDRRRKGTLYGLIVDACVICFGRKYC